MAPVRAFGTPLVEMIGPMPYADWQKAFDTEFPHGRRYYWKGNLLRELADEVLAAVVARAVDPPTPSSLVAFEWYRGPMNRVDPAATAFPHRDARYQLVISGSCDDSADDEQAIGWARGLHQATERFALNGSFLNFNALDRHDGAERVPGRLRPELGSPGRDQAPLRSDEPLPREQQRRAIARSTIAPAAPPPRTLRSGPSGTPSRAATPAGQRSTVNR